jgi:hypothetical protein
LFFSGDFMMPGRLLIDDAAADLASAQRVASFVQDRPVRYVLGAHIEQTRSGELFPSGSTYHPDERPLQMDRADLLALPAALKRFNGFYTQQGRFTLDLGDDLYRDGINRQLFLPFIAMLKARMEIVPVDGGHDYRLGRLRTAGTWFSPIDSANEASFDGLWRDMAGPGEETGATLEVLGRKEHWPRAAGGLLRAHFNSLCVHALGPADYLAIAGRFHTVFLEQVPKLVESLQAPGQCAPEGRTRRKAPAREQRKAGCREITSQFHLTSQYRNT